MRWHMGFSHITATSNLFVPKGVSDRTKSRKRHVFYLSATGSLEKDDDPRLSPVALSKSGCPSGRPSGGRESDGNSDGGCSGVKAGGQDADDGIDDEASMAAEDAVGAPFAEERIAMPLLDFAASDFDRGRCASLAVGGLVGAHEAQVHLPPTGQVTSHECDETVPH